MRKVTLLFSFCVLLGACQSSGSSESATTESSASTESAPTEESVQEASSEELNSDSTTAANTSAVAHQPQIDTSVTKIGTERTGGLVAKGAKLITSSDCTACHKERDKLVGPAYTAVAAKYPSNEKNITFLANKIIQGGKGNWGEIPMSPHPGLALADAKEMATYILSLK